MKKRNFNQIFTNLMSKNPTRRGTKVVAPLEEELEKKYFYYVAIVDQVTKKTIQLFQKALDSSAEITIEKDNNYLISFSEQMDNLIPLKKEDSFSVAACLMYSIMQHNKVKLKICSNVEQEIATYINVFSALNVAFNIISHPTYYYFNGNSIIKKEYPEVAINIPDIVYNDILASITNEYCKNREISVTQFANLLHLIYLSCK